MKKRIKRFLLVVLFVFVALLGLKLYEVIHNPDTLLGGIYQFKQNYEHKNDYDLSEIPGLEILNLAPDSSTFEKNKLTLKDFTVSDFDKVSEYRGNVERLCNDNGPCYSFDEYGNIRCQSVYKKGQPEGVSYCYFSDGSIESVSNYKDGKLDGLSITYDFDGNVRRMHYYSDGIYDGEFVERDFFDGSIVHGYYKNFKKIGIRTGYKASGDVSYIDSYTEDGKRIGYKQYYDYGLNQLQIVKLADDDGYELEKISYYENGNIKEIYRGGSQWGLTKYDEDGNITEEISAQDLK